MTLIEGILEKRGFFCQAKMSRCCPLLEVTWLVGRIQMPPFYFSIHPSSSERLTSRSLSLYYARREKKKLITSRKYHSKANTKRGKNQLGKRFVYGT